MEKFEEAKREESRSSSWVEELEAPPPLPLGRGLLEVILSAY